MKKYLLLTIFLFSGYANAGFETLDEVFDACYAPSDPKMSEALKESNCLGYVSGVIDTAQVIFSLRPASTLFCLPNGGISPEQALIATRKWAKAYPKESKETTARIGLIIGMAQAYPCNN